MSDTCSHGHGDDDAIDASTPGIRRALWIALVINAVMFVVELVGSFGADSVSLLADAIDFLGDASSYALSLAVLGLALSWRARVAYLKGVTMLLWGLWVLAAAGWKAWQGSSPEPVTMGAIGAIALVANVTVAVLLYAFRNGDANLRSVWLCSRNDALSNLAVIGAALGVFGSRSAWPDLAVAAVMGGLALSAGTAVVRQARDELRSTVADADVDRHAARPS